MSIVVSNLEKSFGGRTLFKDVSYQFQPGHRYGIVGANGSGKSTLLSILTGTEEPTKGSYRVNPGIRLGFIQQDHFQSDHQPIIEVAMMGDEIVFPLWSEREKILVDAESGDFDSARLSEIDGVLLQSDGYSIPARSAEILAGLGIATELHEQPLSTLSGGFKMRVLLAQSLIGNPNILLLDEPNNHLDIVSIAWLEQFLINFKGIVITVSHDQRFLNQICTHILDFDYNTIQVYPGNYDHFISQKQSVLALKEKEMNKRQKEIEKQQAFIQRFKAQASKARQAQSKKKMLDRIVLEPIQGSSRRYPNLQFKLQEQTGKDVLRIANLDKSFDENHVLENVNFTVQKGERVGLIGPNGVGKSTLLKCIMSQLSIDRGHYEWGQSVDIGYFAQDPHETLAHFDGTVFEYLSHKYPGLTIGEIRSVMGRCLFEQDDAHKKTSHLSGGESARLLFADIMLQKPNTLILDEPTNHLDLESIQVLNQALCDFEGTVVFVSHNRWLVSRVATKIIEIKPGQALVFPGNYDDFLEQQGEDHLNFAKPEPKKISKTKPDSNSKPESKSKPNQQQNREALRQASKERKKRERKLEETTQKIAKIEKELEELEATLNNPSMYAPENQGELFELHGRQQMLSGRLEHFMEEWEKLETKLERE